MDSNNIVADDKVSSVPKPVTPEGGKDTTVDKSKKEKEKHAVESFASIFDGLDLSDEFKEKINLVFEAAVNEEVNTRVSEMEEELAAQFEVSVQESLDNAMTEITENLDSYLEYAATEWMEENEIAIESGIKVEMAESLMNGLKTLFEEHNIDVEEGTLDIIDAMQEEYDDVVEKQNHYIKENMSLQSEIAELKKEMILNEMAADLTVSQTERFKILSEKVDFEDEYSYIEKLSTLKETFFSDSDSLTTKESNYSEYEDDEIILEEEETKKIVSEHTTINALVEAFNRSKKD